MGSSLQSAAARVTETELWHRLKPEIHRNYIDALEILYRRILKFQLTAYCYLAKGGVSRAARDLVKWDGWDTLLEDVQKQETAFEAVRRLYRDARYDDEWAKLERRHQEAMVRLQSMDSALTGLDQTAKHFNGITTKARYSKLLEWLCDVDPSEVQNDSQKERKSGTCDWLISENDTFEAWKKGPGSLLWLHGKAGSGKTFLASSVVAHLSERAVTPLNRTGLAYFYIRFNDAKKQDLGTVLGSLIRQLCVQLLSAQLQVVPPAIERLNSLQEQGLRPDAKKLEEALTALLGGFEAVFIILDGLDECHELGGERGRLLDAIERFVEAKIPSLHIFCSSRKEPDIDHVLGPLCSQAPNFLIDLATTRRKVDNDIGRYVDSVLSSGIHGRWPRNIKTEIRTKLLEKADGMYVNHLSTQRIGDIIADVRNWV